MSIKEDLKRAMLRLADQEQCMAGQRRAILALSINQTALERQIESAKDRLAGYDKALSEVKRMTGKYLNKAVTELPHEQAVATSELYRLWRLAA